MYTLCAFTATFMHFHYIKDSKISQQTSQLNIDNNIGSHETAEDKHNRFVLEFQPGCTSLHQEKPV